MEDLSRAIEWLMKKEQEALTRVDDLNQEIERERSQAAEFSAEREIMEKALAISLRRGFDHVQHTDGHGDIGTSPDARTGELDSDTERATDDGEKRAVQSDTAKSMAGRIIEAALPLLREQGEVAFSTIVDHVHAVVDSVIPRSTIQSALERSPFIERVRKGCYRPHT